MLVTILTLSLLLFSGNCEKLTPEVYCPKNPTITVCIKNIMQKYFVEAKMIVYVNLDLDDHELLKTIHTMEIISIATKTAPTNGLKLNLAYLIAVRDVPSFSKNIVFLDKEIGWNPYARFLVMIESLEWGQLFQVFDILLSLHVINAVIVNSTDTAELYSYNPYENFACGKYYRRLIEFGKCLKVTANIYPQKVTTGLRNCFFNVSVPHWPPYGIDPSKVKHGTNLIGTEQYIFNLISKIEHFTYKFNFNYNPESFSLVSNNMSVTGPMLMLANNHTDVMLGGLMLIPSRASMFFYIYGHLDYVDELRLMVKRAGPSPAWKDIYHEFSPMVWISLFLILVCYSALIAILLKAKDRGRVLLMLLDNLLSHGCKFQSRQAVKCVFFMWVLFAYLMNSFYTTTLMSLTTKPGTSYQIRDEQAITDNDLQPCISLVMEKFLKSQSNNSEVFQEAEVGTKGCKLFLESIKSVSESYRLFTLIFYSVYLYNKQQFYDEYGRSPVYSFTKPYAKVIYAMYFRNGFPMYERLHVVALRIRETGLSEKSLNDHLYDQTIKYHFRSQGFQARFAVPWYPYVIGLCISSIIFVVELASEKVHRKVQISPVNK